MKFGLESILHDLNYCRERLLTIKSINFIVFTVHIKNVVFTEAVINQLYFLNVLIVVVLIFGVCSDPYRKFECKM